MTLSAFPDINVWIAMTFAGHAHHAAAREWFYSLDDSVELVFCRFTQLGFLRLLTLSPVMGGSVKTQRQAWQQYDAFILDGNVRMMAEPVALEESFRRLSTVDSSSPQYWGDSYLSAFAEQTGVRLVTFDKALAARSANAILLSAAMPSPPAPPHAESPRA
jgi:toxin-antitoxin system PIN domain toxin